MDSVNRLRCEIKENNLLIELFGEICSGDLINFSYSMNRKLSKLSPGFTLLCNASSAKLNLMDGLAMQIFVPFFKEALERDAKRIAVMLPFIYRERHPPDENEPRIRFFGNDFEAAQKWIRFESETGVAIS